MIKLLTGATGATASKWADWLDQYEAATRRKQSTLQALDAARSAHHVAERHTLDQFNRCAAALANGEFRGWVPASPEEAQRMAEQNAAIRARGGEGRGLVKAGAWSPPYLSNAADASARERFIAALEADAETLNIQGRAYVKDWLFYLRPDHEQLQEATTLLEQAEAAHAEAEQALDKIEAARPPVNDGAAKALGKACELALREIERIERVLAKAEGDREALETERAALDLATPAAAVALAEPGAEQDAAQKQLDKAHAAAAELDQRIARARELEQGLAAALSTAHTVAGNAERHKAEVMRLLLWAELRPVEEKILQLITGELTELYAQHRDLLRKMGHDVPIRSRQSIGVPILLTIDRPADRSMISVSGDDLNLPLDADVCELIRGMVKAKPRGDAA